MATAGEMTAECSGGKDQRDRGLDVENNRHTMPRGALFPVPRIRPPPKSPETTPVCRFTAAADNMAGQRRAGGTNLVMLHSVDQCVT